MFDSVDDLLKKQIKLHRLGQPPVEDQLPATRAINTFYDCEAELLDYFNLVSEAIEALTIYNDVIHESALGPNPSNDLARRSYCSSVLLKQMKQTLDHIRKEYDFLKIT